MADLRIAVQLYTLRSLMDKDFWGTLQGVHDIGLRYVEMAGLHGHEAAEVRKGLDKLGIHAVSGHYGLDALTKNLDTTVKEAKTLGLKYIVLPWIDKSSYTDGWDVFAKSLVPVAQNLKKHGFKFGYHNHAFEFESFREMTGFQKLFSTAPKDLVLAEVDCYWVQYGGKVPAEMIRFVKGRVPLSHFKDMSSDQDRHYVEVGHGTLDWDSIIKACREGGTEYAIIELDECPRDPLESVKMSFDFLKSKGLRVD